jgi:DHA3 family macrolide efflux protein-like MFS transporter
MTNETSSIQPFLRMWLGQLVSIIGTGMTQFALAIWIWSQTSTITSVVLTTTFFFIPTVFFGPFAGALVDRWNRKRLMLACDTVSALVSLTLLGLVMTGTLQVWNLYLTALISGTMQCLQIPAMMASASTLAPKDRYSRAATLIGLSDSLGQILAPALGGLLYALISVSGILMLDIITFFIAITMMIGIRIPDPEVTEVGQQAKSTLLKEALFGFRFIAKHRNLLYLLLFMVGVNCVLELWASFLSPMVLARTGNNTSVLGWVQAAGGIGAIVGSIVLSRLRVPKNYMSKMLLSLGLIGILTMPIGFKDAVPLWVVAHFAFFFIHSFLGTYHQSIWQSKVPQDVQGRVFAVRRLTFGVSALIAPGMLGFLADRVFEPAIAVPSQINHLMGWMVGSHQGDGLAAMFVLGGILLAIIALLGYAVPALRNLEMILPSYHTKPVSA